MQLWVNGESVISVTGLSMRNVSDSLVQGMHFQTFFGGTHSYRCHWRFEQSNVYPSDRSPFAGSTSDWASPQNQTAWFADVSGAVITS